MDLLESVKTLVFWKRLEQFSGFAVCGFRGLWNMLFFMKGGIRNGLAAVCIWIFYDLAGSVQNHEGRSGTTT